VEPSLASYGSRITGGTFTPSDESGDARVFTQELAKRCAERGVRFLWQHDVAGFERQGQAVTAVRVRDRPTQREALERADQYVAAMGSFTAPMLRPLGVDLDIYPAKGYSATMRLKRPEAASVVSMIDDARKIAISRLGEHIRIAGTAEMAGYDDSIDSPRSRVRCESLVKRYEELFPGVADTSEPNYWAGLRPSTPNNLPYIGRSSVPNLWLNAGHGTLGWTHGAGSGRALAALIGGRRPALDYGFCGDALPAARPQVSMGTAAPAHPR